jgi:hypothetical protein
MTLHASCSNTLNGISNQLNSNAIGKSGMQISGEDNEFFLMDMVLEKK